MRSGLKKTISKPKTTQDWFVPATWEWVRPLRRRVALAVLLFAGIPVISLSLYDVLQLRRRAMAAAEDRLHQAAESGRDLIWRELRRYAAATKNTVANLSLQNDLELWLKGGTDAEAAGLRVRNTIGTVVNGNGFHRAWFVDRNGRALLMAEKKRAKMDSPESATVVTSYLTGVGPDLSGEEFFKGTLEQGELFVCDVHRSKRTGEIELIFAAPVWKPAADGDDSDKQLLGVWANVVRPEDTLFPMLKVWAGAGSTGEIYLYREENGTQVFISPTRFRPAATLLVTVPWQERRRLPVQRPRWGEESAYVARDYRGEATLMVSLPVIPRATNDVPQLRWMLVAKQDRSEALGPELNELLARSTLFTLLAFLGLGLLAYSIEKRLASKRLAVAYNYATSLINSDTSIIYAVDKKYRIQHVNKPLALFGPDSDDSLQDSSNVLGKNILDAIATAEIRPLYKNVLDDIFCGRRVSFAREAAFGPPDNPSHWFMTISRLVVDGKIEGAVVALMDMTERIRMNREIERRNRELRLLYGVNRAITEVVDVDVILRRVVEGAREALGAGEAALLRYDAQTGELTRGVATDSKLSEFQSRCFGTEEGSPMALVVHGRKSIASEDFTREPYASFELAKVLGAKSGVCVPLVYQSAVVGCLFVYETTHPRAFSDEEIRLLEEIARQAAVAIQHATLFKAHKDSQERLQYLLDNIQQVIWQVDAQGRIVFLNRAFESVFGYPASEWLQRPLEPLVVPECLPDVRRLMSAALAGQSVSGELELRTARGVRLLAGTFGPLRDPDGKIVGVQALTQDVTEQRQLQEQLNQAQKMDSLGALAGGVAHDFNNVLTAMSGYCSLLLAECPPDHPWYKQLKTIDTSTQRMAQLTRQLLAFSRKTAGHTEKIDLNRHVNEVLTILHHSFDPSIVIEFVPGENLPVVNADPAQLNQVLMNLCINARDAMPNGGRIKIETREVYLDAHAVRRYIGLEAGNYVRLTVSDTGHGIPVEVQHRIFEPFFTTKPMGKGAGLGLSVTYGIVKSHKGHIGFVSQPGKGTTFEVLLPAADGKQTEPETQVAPQPSHGSETILMVDDEEILLELGKTILESYGYKVLACSNPLEAVEVYRARQQEIGLVLSDIVMPKMNGHDLYLQLRSINSRVKVLLSSGYSADGVAQNILQMGAVGFLQKPYRAAEMVAQVRQALDSPDPIETAAE